MTDPLINAYLARLTLAGYRPQTIRTRSIVLTAFAATVPGGLRAATRLDVESYLSRPLAQETRRAYRTHLRGFYAWASEEGHLPADPTERVPPIRQRRGTPRPLSTADLAHVLDSTTGRMRAWLLLMVLAGLRCMEVAGLRPCDVLHLDGGPLLYLRECKGGAPATIPAHPLIVEALAALPVRDGRWWDVSPGTVSRDVAETLRAAGIPATAHALRHSAATVWLRASGHDLLTTARLMRHASVNTTTVYAELDPARPREVIAAVALPA